MGDLLSISFGGVPPASGYSLLSEHIALLVDTNSWSIEHQSLD